MASSSSSFLSNPAFERFGSGHTLSKNAFVAMLCFWTAAGIAVSAACAYATLDWRPGLLPLILLALVPFAGILIAAKSTNPVISLLGYGLVVVPFGLSMGPIVAMYTAASVVKVLCITTGMVVGLGLIGAIYPKSLESWGIYLLGALLVLILSQLVVIILALFGVNVSGAMTLLDWAGVAIFSLLVVYDLNRAMRVERTHDNAIDCAVGIYLDFINIFLRLLSLMGKRKD